MRRLSLALVLAAFAAGTAADVVQEDTLWEGSEGPVADDCRVEGGGGFLRKTFAAPRSERLRLRIQLDEAVATEDVALYHLEIYVR